MSEGRFRPAVARYMELTDEPLPAATTSKRFISQVNSEAINRFVKRKIPAGHHTQRGFVLKEEKLSDYFALRQARLAAGLVSQEAASASVRIARMNHRSLAKPLRNSSN